MIRIPNYGELEIKNIVCDYNGTIAKDGVLLHEVGKLFHTLSDHYSLYVITADTFGSVQNQMEPFGCEVKILTSDNHTAEKEAFIRELGAAYCVVMGNGNNDVQMLKAAALAIAILGDEGCAKDTMLMADIVCKNAVDALELLSNPKRLVATLRR